MLSLAGERLTPKVLDHYLHHDLVMLLLLWRFFAHLLILEYLDHHQNLISSLLYYQGPLHKLSSQFIHTFLSNVVHKQTNRQTHKPKLPKTLTWRKCVRNIFSIPYNTHCTLVHLIAQDSSVRVKLHKRYLKFFNSASKSNNTLVSMMSRIIINGSGSTACTSVNFICSIYDLSKYDISLSLLSKLKDNDEECAIQCACTIVDFLHYYDTYPEQSVREIVNYLCTF